MSADLSTVPRWLMWHRSVLALLLGLLCVAAARPVRAQQAPTLHIARANGELVFDVGPVELPAHAGHDAVHQPPPLTAVFPVDGWFHGFTVELIDESGRPIPKTLLHHVNVIAPEKRELFSDIMLRLGASGTETSPVLLPRVLGYHVRRGDSLLVSAMLHNPTDRSYVATLRIRAPYTPSDARFGALDIYPFYLDATPPAGSHSFDVPPGRSEHFWEGKPAIAGRIVGVSGHLHKYGVELKLEDRTAHRIIWDARPAVDSAGEIIGMPIQLFLWTLGVPVRPDHVYRVTAVYDNPTGATIEDGGMGALGGAFLPSDPRGWPAIDHTHADYAIDYRATYRLDESAEMAHHHMP